MAHVSVRAADAEDLTAFLAVPDAVYQRDAHRSYPSASAVTASVRRADFAGRQQILLGYLDDTSAARLVARCSPTLTDEKGCPLGLLGFFESADHPPLAAALFAQAFAWLRTQGVATVLGPMDGDTWHSYRLNLGPPEPRPFLMEPHNPPYYPALWEASGFAVVERYFSKEVDDLPAALAATSRIAERWRQRGGVMRPLHRETLRDELTILYRLSCAIFAANRFYTPIPLEEFLTLYQGVEPLLVDGFNWFALDAQGQEIGFVFAFPDLFRAIQAMRGRRDAIAKLRFLLLRRRVDTVNIKSLGVLPAHQRTGVALALMHEVYARAHAKGYQRANLCLIREGNASGRMDGDVGHLLRNYALYARNL